MNAASSPVERPPREPLGALEHDLPDEVPYGSERPPEDESLLVAASTR